MYEWIRQLYADPNMARMGHAQSIEDQNLGSGWIYYGLARALRPSTAVVIGSFRGFVPLVLGKALQDNGRGDVVFIDPSLVDDFWLSPPRVRRHFKNYGITNVRHYCCTTQEFVTTEGYRSLGEIGLLFVDGYHTEEQAQFDFAAFEPKLRSDALVLFHDSVRERQSSIYGENRAYTHSVCRFMESLRLDPAYQVLSLCLGDGLTVVSRAQHHPDPRQDLIEATRR